ncbi:MAG: sodium:solute symporter [Christensenellales bacterium]
MYLAFILIYLVAISLVGIACSRRTKGANFVNVDGGIPWRVNAGTLIATYVGSGAIMGGATLAFNSGYNAIWLYAGGWLAVLAHVLLYKRIKHMSGLTVSELIGARYGETARFISALIIMTAEISIVAYNLKSTGLILNVVTGMNADIAMIVATVVIVFITVVAGLVSVAYTDYVQAIVILVSFIVALPILVKKGGGVSGITAALPEEFFHPMKSFSWSYALQSMLPTFCLVFMSQGFWQRFAASRSQKELKKTVIAWLIGVVLIAMLIITFATFSAAVVPEASADTVVMYVAKAALPTVIGLMVLAATTSVLVTTADSYLLSGASVFINDIYCRHINKNADKKKVLSISRISVIICGIIAYVLISFFPTILSMIYFAYTMEGGLIVPMIGMMFWKRATPQGGIAAVATVFIVTILWEISKPFGIATIFATLIIGTLVLVIVSLLTPPPAEKYLERFDFSKTSEGK